MTIDQEMEFEPINAGPMDDPPDFPPDVTVASGNYTSDADSSNTREADGRELARAKNNEYAIFVDGVLSDDVAFYQVSKSFLVVNGWDSKSRSSTVCILKR